ncbi:hypothetical protein AB0H00_30855 [Nocardia sp. NPDC023852]|uniref:hypothetical protein n=1 Tax=Nocardia sp. NPDC023852 TaxID=3154697 RepID=UPI0033C7F7F1
MSYTTSKGVLIEVDQRYTDVYRDGARVIAVVEIAEPRTDHKGVERCEITYRVVVRDGVELALTRVQTMDAARLTDTRLYQLVEEAR